MKDRKKRDRRKTTTLTEEIPVVLTRDTIPVLREIITEDKDQHFVNQALSRVVAKPTTSIEIDALSLETTQLPKNIKDQ